MEIIFRQPGFPRQRLQSRDGFVAGGDAAHEFADFSDLIGLWYERGEIWSTLLAGSEPGVLGVLGPSEEFDVGASGEPRLACGRRYILVVRTQPVGLGVAVDGGGPA